MYDFSLHFPSIQDFHDHRKSRKLEVDIRRQVTYQTTEIDIKIQATSALK